MPAPEDSPPDGRAVKRRRINFACNYCRNRKSRCDEQKPSCRACIVAGVPCVTTDRRRPGVAVQRRESGQHGSPELNDIAGPSRPQGLDRSLCSVGDVEVYRDDPRSADGSSPGNTAGVPGAEDANQSANQTQGFSTHKHDRFEGRLPIARQSRGNTSLEVVADWLHLATRRLDVPLETRTPSGQARPWGPGLEVPLTSNLPPFPEIFTAIPVLTRFLDGINVLHPLLNREQFKADFETATELGPTRYAAARGIARLAQVYLVLAIGLASDPRALPGVGPGAYREYCKSLLGSIACSNDVDGVRAAALAALCSRIYDDCSSAWNTLSLAVSMAMSLGLHRPRTRARRLGRAVEDTYSNYLLDDKERRTLWLAIFSFEKLLAFELGRSSSITDEVYQLSRHDAANQISGGVSRRDRAFAVTVDLARALSEVGRRCILVAKKEERTEDGESLNAVIFEKVQTTAEMFMLLTSWADSIPEEFRPTSDLTFDPDLYPFVVYISLHYNNAVLLLLRNCLLISDEAIAATTDSMSKDQPWGYVVRNGQSIVASASRRVLNILLGSADATTSLPTSILGPLHALFVLAIYRKTHTRSRLAGMDLALIQEAVECLEEVYGRLAGDGKLKSLLFKFRQLLPRQCSIRRDTSSPSRNGFGPSPREFDDGVGYGHQAANIAAGQGGYNAPLLSPSSYQQAPATPDASNNYSWYGTLDSTISLPIDDECSPSLPDEIGWDWSDFTRLLSGPSNEVFSLDQ